MGSWIAEEDKHRIVRLRKQCMRPAIIALTVGVTTAVVYKVLQKYAYKNDYTFPILMRKDYITEKQVRVWKEMRDTGMKNNEIAILVGKTPETVSKKINELIREDLVDA